MCITEETMKQCKDISNINAIIRNQTIKRDQIINDIMLNSNITYEQFEKIYNYAIKQ